ncbi:PEP-CTERM sorting domain-containing protein [Inhella proteolytica]|uniref:PEP-CTERM sorting domain-containing protein n=1 Tax=Inhella proteolytica TaxID=2795029 RepID=A0A931NFH5_9BURK|nr:PEP-CTERM sorting domain-containing protein [Inhella proteolytica]MBH9578792.1 PEP-CTERM sorting domain-containing protein [Inhella proteolytica]
MRNTTLATFALASSLLAPAFAAPVQYNNRALFQSQLAASVTDDYQNPGYGGSFAILSNAAMGAVLNETKYTTTGFSDWNIVTGGMYCAGCNGSFLLDFTSTSVGDASGVFGVGLDVVASDNSYFARITFGDDSVEELLVSGAGSFWGLTSSMDIKSIHFGLAGGVATTGGYFQIDNLTVGSDAGQHVPEPMSLALAGLGLLGVGLAKRRARG